MLFWTERLIKELHGFDTIRMIYPMSVVKDRIMRIVRDQPEESSYDDILKELAFARMIDKGIEDADYNRIRSNSDVANLIDSWQK